MRTRVGITGHRRLADPSAWSWVRAAMAERLRTLPGPIEGVTSLAAGADQVFAQVVLGAGGSLRAVIPFPDYARTLQDDDLSRYHKLLARSACETLPAAENEEAFWAAGRRVVELSDLLLAVWDGLPARGLGGTANVVSYARGRSVPVVHINPVSRTVA